MLAGAAWLPAQKERGKKDKNKLPDLELVDFKVRRDDRNFTVDGRVRNISAKPMKGMILFFEFLESDQKMIGRMTAEVTKDELAPGEDAAFETQTKAQARAISVRLDAEDLDGRGLRLDRPGPHEIE